jgi:hypothetical protein
MDNNEYCMNVSKELNVWKNEISKELDKISHIPAGEKQHMHGVVEDLMMLEAEMADRIDQLESACQTSWDADKVHDIIDPSGATSHILGEKESEGYIGGGNFGG